MELGGPHLGAVMDRNYGLHSLGVYHGKSIGRTFTRHLGQTWAQPNCLGQIGHNHADSNESSELGMTRPTKTGGQSCLQTTWHESNVLAHLGVAGHSWAQSNGTIEETGQPRQAWDDLDRHNKVWNDATEWLENKSPKMSKLAQWHLGPPQNETSFIRKNELI